MEGMEKSSLHRPTPPLKQPSPFISPILERSHRAFSVVPCEREPLTVSGGAVMSPAARWSTTVETFCKPQSHGKSLTISVMSIPHSPPPSPFHLKLMDINGSY